MILTLPTLTHRPQIKYSCGLAGGQGSRKQWDETVNPVNR
jgi:hypothetical protein